MAPCRRWLAAYDQWEVEGDILQMLWEERNGPVVRNRHRALGTRSVIASIESQLGGQAEFRLALRRPDLPAIGPAAAGWNGAAAQQPSNGHATMSGGGLTPPGGEIRKRRAISG